MINCTNDREVYSHRPGGATVGMADGAVQFLKADVSIRVLARLATRAGARSWSGADY